MKIPIKWINNRSVDRSNLAHAMIIIIIIIIIITGPIVTIVIIAKFIEDLFAEIDRVELVIRWANEICKNEIIVNQNRTISFVRR